MDELVEVVLVAGAQIDEGLDCLVGIGRDVLTLGCFDGADCVIGEVGEVSYAVIDVCGFVDADEGFVEDLEEVAEEFQGCWLCSLLLACKAEEEDELINGRTSSMISSIMALSRCRRYSLKSCFRCANSSAPSRICTSI
jgi:hypothetical protein